MVERVYFRFLCFITYVGKLHGLTLAVHRRTLNYLISSSLLGLAYNVLIYCSDAVGMIFTKLTTGSRLATRVLAKEIDMPFS